MSKASTTPSPYKRLSQVLAGLLCAAWLAVAVHGTSGVVLMTPDTAQYAITARSIVRGEGYTINMIRFFPGLYDSVSHVPELHGLLRPIALAALFRVAGVDGTLVRIPGLAYVALAAFVAFVFARRVFGEVAGFLACLMTLANWTTLLWACSGTDDTGFAFFFLCSMYFLYLGLSERRDAQFALAGTCAGFALLEKLSGLVIPGIFLGAILVLARDAPWRTALRWATYLMLPFALCFSLYMVRNYAAYGGLMFRLGALHWLIKPGGMHAFWVQFYDKPPDFFEVLASIGRKEVMLILFRELLAFLSLVFLPEVPVGGNLNQLGWSLLSIPVILWRHTRFTGIALLSLLGFTLFVCGFHHVEVRYFVPLIPLFAVAAAGAIETFVRGVGFGWMRSASRAAAVAVALTIALWAALVTYNNLQAHRWQIFRDSGPCRDATDWIKQNTERDERILTVDPGWLSWTCDRPAIMIPGSRADVLRVARHYDARLWIRSPAIARVNVDKLLGGYIQADLLFDGNECDVYRLSWPEGAKATE